jgi:putative tryptophan/tyrosine transport system substrate-binding protein
MRRRDFVAGLGSALGWPALARAQRAMPIIGYLNPGSPGEVEATDVLPAFRRGLAEVGYVEGRNVAIEYRFADQDNARLPALAKDLASRGVAVIAAVGGSAPALAAKAATTTIPIVFRTGADPVRLGLVASLNRPGGNLTGIAAIGHSLWGKRLELIRELVPQATMIGSLVNQASFDNETEWKEFEAVVKPLGIRLLRLEASNPAEIERAFGQLVDKQAQALLAGDDAFFYFQREQLVSLAARYRVPTIYHAREAVEAGGLMSYGQNNSDGHRRAGIYTGRILKGERPAELPVEQATRLEMLLNRKTARTLGVAVPETLLVEADEVIE